MVLDLHQLGLEFGSGAVVGAIMGFAAKKIAKLVAVLVGAQMALFRFLESEGYLVVRWDRLTYGMLEASQAAQGNGVPSWVYSLLSTLSIGAGFTGGFLVGFRKG